jgi:hypothetical protein
LDDSFAAVSPWENGIRKAQKAGGDRKNSLFSENNRLAEFYQILLSPAGWAMKYRASPSRKALKRSLGFRRVASSCAAKSSA